MYLYTNLKKKNGFLKYINSPWKRFPPGGVMESEMLSSSIKHVIYFKS